MHQIRILPETLAAAAKRRGGRHYAFPTIDCQQNRLAGDRHASLFYGAGYGSGSSGTIVDATIIDAPSSTKNREGKRDSEMHQTKKGNQWYFGMKAHIGVDSQSKLIHPVVVTAANAHDSQVLGDLLHGEETRAWGDLAYAGKGEVIREHAPKAKDFTNQKGYHSRPLTDEDRAKNRTNSKVRAKVEYLFLAIKRIFGFSKVRYRGLDKNAYRVFVACGLANLYMARRVLLRPT